MVTLVSWTAQRWVGSASSAAPVSGPEDLLEDQHAAGLERTERARQRGLGGSGRQAAVACPPRVEVNGVEGALQDGALHAQEDRLRAGRQLLRHWVAGQGGRRQAGYPRVEQRAGRDRHADGIGLGADGDQGPGVAALADRVVDQPGMPAQRDAAARGAEVGLGADRVLLVAQVIRGVREHLGQRDAEVGGVRLGPPRREHRQPVQHHLQEAGVVLGQVVDVRRAWRRRAGSR